MHGFGLPYQPLPQRLYSSADLFRGFDPSQPASWTKTLDFEIYRHFVIEGRARPRNPYMGMMQALHDNAVTQATNALIEGRKVVAIIGDHAMTRNSDAYKKAAVLARRLTRRGMLVCTGGGPGAMEAGHLGAALAKANDDALDRALARLTVQPLVPALAKIVDDDGGVNNALATEACKWFAPAFELAKSINPMGESLAIPTWGYGHEPPTPFATHIAKYFQNSIREDGLLAIASQGIICMEGKAGTLQEIFQDAALNYYRTSGPYSPMVLLGVDLWTTTYPVVGVLRQLFGAEFANSVLVTDDVEAAARFIEDFSA